MYKSHGKQEYHNNYKLYSLGVDQFKLFQNIKLF